MLHRLNLFLRWCGRSLLLNILLLRLDLNSWLLDDMYLVLLVCRRRRCLSHILLKRQLDMWGHWLGRGFILHSLLLNLVRHLLNWNIL